MAHKGDDKKANDSGSKADLDDDFERPEWDDEKYRNSMEDDEEFERPEWDDETYRHKKQEDDEEFERPEWDEESWFNRLKKPFGSLYLQVGGALAVLVLLAIAIPSTRSQVLNVAGARGSVSFTILDQETAEPLTNVNVTLGDKTESTDSRGIVRFSDVKLGRYDLVIEKSAYETITQTVEVGWGETVIDNVNIKPIGQRFEFNVVDWLSGDPIEDARVSYEAISESSGADGLVDIVIVPPEGSSTVNFVFAAEGYIDQTIGVNTGSTEVTQISLVIDEKHHFIDSQKETQSIYSVNADGTGRELLISGNAISADDMLFSVSPDGDFAAMVARDSNESSDFSLMIISLETGQSSVQSQSPRIDLLGWSGDRIVFIQQQPDETEDSAVRHAVYSQNVKDLTDKVLIASANVFNDVLVAEDFIYFAPSGLNNPDIEPALKRVRVDGTGEVTIVEQEAWTVVRADFDSIRFNADNQWYETPINEVANSPVSEPTSEIGRLYTQSPYNSDLSVWVDLRESSGALILRQTGEESEVYNIAGLRDPIRWLSEDHLVFRVNSGDEIADYIYSISGDIAAKLVDVSDVRGVENWYYYYE